MVVKCIHIWLAAAAILLLAALLIIFWPEEVGSSDAVVTFKARQGEERWLSEFETPRQSVSRNPSTRIEIILSEHEQDQLVDFVLPPFEGHRVSLQGAVKSLLAAYHDACRRSRTTPLNFDFSFPSENDKRISFSIERGTFAAALSRIAGLAGYREIVDGLAISFDAMMDNPEPHTRTFRVPPGFAEDLRNELRHLGIAHGSSIEDLLVAAGIIRPGGQVLLDPAGTLTATLSVADLERIQQRIPQGGPQQLKAALKLIHSETSLEETVKSLTSEEHKKLLAMLVGKEGVRITTMPSVTMRDQQPANIEVIENLGDGWTGVKWNLEGERMGLATLFRTSAEYRPAGHPKRYARGNTYGVSADGVPHFSLIHEGEGEFLYQMLTLEIIDSTGRPVRGPENSNFAEAAAVPGKSGFVFSPYNNKMVDVRDIPPGTLVADPHYPLYEKRFFRVP